MGVKFVLAESPYPRSELVVEAPAETPQPAAAKAATPAAGAGAAPAPKKDKPTPIVMNEDDFKNDPLIKKALEIFKGQIVEIRTGAAT